jgi:tight adherence protein B
MPVDAAYKWGAFALIVLSLLIAAFFIVGDDQGAVMRYWARYCAFLERKLRLMFIWTPGRTIALGQLAGMFVVAVFQVSFGLPGWYIWLALIAGGPPYWIERKRQKRIESIEDQLDGFLMALANALKATPSIANAFISVQHLLPTPIKEEVELATKEMRLGSTLDQALLNMAGRVGSRQLDTALSAILIGRQIGGDLPKILETTAATLREMARLEGVVRSKTAEGKAQAWVLALFPIFLGLSINWISAGYFHPLSATVVGWIVSGLAGIFWLASLLVARKVLAVDI